MSKKKDKKKKEKVNKQKEVRILKGICLNCGKPMGKNFNNCSACSKKKRLERKANKRGKTKDYYIRGYS